MSTTDNAYAAFSYQQISLAALASLRNAAGAGVLGQGIDLLVNNHCVLHGTPDENVKSIQMNGFKDSTCGMLGCGVYGAHSYDKAKAFAGQDGTVFCIRFRGDKVCCTDTTDLSGSWRENGPAMIASIAIGRDAGLRCASLSKISQVFPSTQAR
ncbi:unnamed protein product [Cladocopium goreaui]|uniref:PARP catalytic domain-containing protein n=1 Tax=Cladocopium goreaui TaxID=2562237 RepID=A0A9P1C458_9DINO|nr:unnamed protein product [Cladocopium goreaui]